MWRPVGKLCGALLLAGSSLAFAQQYTISTAAGGAPPPTPVAPASTSIGQPTRVLVDSQGNIYFSANNAVFKISGSVLSLVAGNSRAGFSGDGGPAVQAQLNGPQGLALDKSNNLYIADSKNNRVRMVNPAGNIFTFAGTGQTSAGGANTFNDGGLATNGLLRLPSGLAVDTNGNIYIADTGDNLIRKVTTDGIIHTIAGDSYPGFLGDTFAAINAEFHSPEDVAVDSSFNIYIADSANAAIRKITTDGIINTIAGNGTIGDTGDTGLSTKAALFTPYAVVVDSSGNIYFTENGDSKVRKVDTKSIITTVVGTGTAGFSGDGGLATKAQLNFATGVSVDSSGNLYIADLLNNRIRKVAGGNISTIAGNGLLSFSGDGGAATSAQLNTPQAVAADSSGNLYIADTFNNVVRKVSGGNISTFAGNGTAGFGGDGGAATSAQLNGPQGIAVDPAGNVYVSDSQNARVRKISGGTITTVAGNGTPGFGGDNGSATSAMLNVPIGLALDSSGNLYIADFSNNRIRKVSGGTITTIAGNGGAGYTGDGGPATSAMLYNPISVAVDGQGNVFIADSGTNRVREVTNNVIVTVAGNGQPGFSGDNVQATTTAVGNPSGVAVDSSGNLYISDGSVRVRKVNSTGFITTIGGNGTRGYSGDTGPGNVAMLSAPIGLALLPNGNVYIADSGNNAIRLLTFGGFQTTVAAAANSASNLAGPVSAGEVVVFYGSGLGPANLTVNTPGANGVYSTSLAGTTVYFGNIKAPILFTSAVQVAVVVPFAVSGSSIQVTIQNQNSFSATFPVTLAQLTPGIYTADLTGKGLAAAINLHNGVSSYNGTANPASAGDYVSIFLTGAGQTNPPGMDGVPYPGLATCSTPAIVTLASQTITPQYCGGVPGSIPGLTQINILIPPGLSAGNAPVTVQFGGISAQPGVTIAVSGK